MCIACWKLKKFKHNYLFCKLGVAWPDLLRIPPSQAELIFLTFSCMHLNRKGMQISFAFMLNFLAVRGESVFASSNPKKKRHTRSKGTFFKQYYAIFLPKVRDYTKVMVHLTSYSPAVIDIQTKRPINPIFLPVCFIGAHYMLLKWAQDIAIIITPKYVVFTCNHQSKECNFTVAGCAHSLYL